MILYISIISVATLLVCGFNWLFGSVCVLELGVVDMSLLVVLGVVIVFVIDMIVSAVVMVVPVKVFKGCTKVYKWEKKFYDKLKIKKWKDLIPIGRGPLGLGMDKSSLEAYDTIDNLEKLIAECVKAEAMHFLSMLLGFALIFIFPLKYALVVCLPIALVNMFLQALPCIVQRYNLPKLEILLKRKQRQYSNDSEILSNGSVGKL